MSSLQQKTEDLSQRLSSSLERFPTHPSAKAVHRLRTAIRRVESAVDYAQPDLGRKQERALEKLAALRRKAGKLRDIDVQIGLLDETANGSAAADRRMLAGRLEQKRDKQAKRLVAAAEKIANSKTLAHVEKILAKAAPSNSASNPAGPLNEAQHRLNEVEKTFSSHSPDPAQLHETRIAIKKLRYIGELAGKSAEQQRFLEQLKGAQDALGSWHDWVELSVTIEKQFRNRVNCPLLVEARALVADKQTTATAVIRQLFAKEVELPARKEARAAVASGESIQRAG